MRNHNNLRAFELADQLVLVVYEVTKSLPKEEMFGLTSQLRRASLSVASNIVEGCSRESQRDFQRFIEIPFGSAKEVEYQLSVAFRLNYLDQSAFDQASSIATETCKVLNGLLKSLRC